MVCTGDLALVEFLLFYGFFIWTGWASKILTSNSLVKGIIRNGIFSGKIYTGSHTSLSLYFLNSSDRTSQYTITVFSCCFCYFLLRLLLEKIISGGQNQTAV